MLTPERLSAAGLRTLLGTYRDLLHQHAARLNRLNVYPVPDGDTGTNMSRTLDAAVNALDGVADPRGTVIFLTTNHKSRLDPALIRAGRCDVQVLRLRLR